MEINLIVVMPQHADSFEVFLKIHFIFSMSFVNKNFGSKPSLLKPAIILVAVLLLVGGAYSLLGGKKDTAKSSEEAATNDSGLDKGQKVKTVGDVEEVVAKWIEANPQAVLMSLQNMQKKSAESVQKDAKKNIVLKKEELFNDKNSPEYAPSGYDVTIVAFFDYACGYCKKADTTIDQLTKEDKKIRIVYKEFPILGAPSIEMATVALAVNMVDPKAYPKFHEALMKTNERGKAAALKAAKTAGVNVSKVEEIIRSKQQELGDIIQANLMLGSTIGVNGTPGFVIGEELIPGAFELSAFKEKVAAVRAK